MQSNNDPRYYGFETPAQSPYAPDDTYPAYPAYVPDPAYSVYPGNEAAYPAPDAYLSNAAYAPDAIGPAPAWQAPAPLVPWAPGPAPYPLAPQGPAPLINPLEAPLAADVLGASTLNALSNDTATLSWDLAGSLFAANLVGKGPGGTSLAGGGFAIGGSLVPSGEYCIKVLGPALQAPGYWFVESRKSIGMSGALAVGGGIALLGGGAMVGAAWEQAWTYITLVPEQTARLLVPTSEKNSFAQLLRGLDGQKNLVAWPDVSNLDNIGIGEAMRTSRLRRGTVGVVISSALQNGAGYVSLTGTFNRVVWRPSRDVLQIADDAAHITEVGASLGFSIVEKVDISRENTHATRVVMQFDLTHAQGRQAAQKALSDDTLPYSMNPRDGGSWSERFFYDLPAGVSLVKIEAVAQQHTHAGAGLFDSLARLVKASGLGVSYDGISDVRHTVDAAGVLTMETRGHLRQKGMLWLGTGSELVYVNAQYGTPHGRQAPIFLGLVLGMQYELTRVQGHNRNAFIDKLNAAFGLQIPAFEAIQSHKGWYVAITRTLGAQDLQQLAQMSAHDLRAAGIGDAKQLADLQQLIAMLRDAHLRATQAPVGQLEDGYSPLLLAEAATDNDASTSSVAHISEAGSAAIAQGRVLQQKVTGMAAVGALCRLLGNNAALQARVRSGACEAPLEKVQNFSLEFGGERARVRAGDTVDEVQRRFERAYELRKLVEQGLEALDKDVAGRVLAPDDQTHIGRALGEAFAVMARAISLDDLTPRQQLALLRQPDIFKWLPPAEQARALCLFDAFGTSSLDDDDDTRRRFKAYRALDAEASRLEKLVLPPAQAWVRRAQLEDISEARASLSATEPVTQARTWGPVTPLEPPPDAVQAAMAAARLGDPLHKLYAYDVHLIVQDNAAMRAHTQDVRDTLAALIPVLQNYDYDGIELSFAGDVLAHAPPLRIYDANALQQLDWINDGSDAMMGNAMEGAVGDFIRRARMEPYHKLGAFIVLTTGDMPDRRVFADALARAKEAIGPQFEDEICVGILQLKHEARSGAANLTWLDKHKRVGSMVDAQMRTDLPVSARIMPLLTGMLNPEQDAANDGANTAQAVSDLAHNILHWKFGKRR